MKGKITNWNAERGFGFLTPIGGGERVFVHVTAILDRERLPAEGDVVTYDVVFDERQRPRAVGVRSSTPFQRKSKGATAQTSGALALVVGWLFVLVVTVGTLFGRLPPIVVMAYGVMSMVTFLAYWFDKSAAQRGMWRTQESSLLLLGLAGGWPGAVIAQRWLRHKSRKHRFQRAFWLTVGMNCLVLTGLFTRSGSRFLDQLLK